MTKNEAIITGFSNVDSILTADVYCPGLFYYLDALFPRNVITPFLPGSIEYYDIISSTRTNAPRSNFECNRESDPIISDTFLLGVLQVPGSSRCPIRTDLEES